MRSGYQMLWVGQEALYVYKVKIGQDQSMENSCFHLLVYCKTGCTLSLLFIVGQMIV